MLAESNGDRSSIAGVQPASCCCGCAKQAAAPNTHAESGDAPGRTQNELLGQLPGQKHRSLAGRSTGRDTFERVPEVQHEFRAPVRQDHLTGSVSGIRWSDKSPQPIHIRRQCLHGTELTVVHAKGTVSRDVAFFQDGCDEPR